MRALIAALVFCGTALTVGLAAAPQLHDRLHQSNGPAHQCAATLLSHGSWEHSACEPIVMAPHATVMAQPFIPAAATATARRDYSILEHAPPANS